MYSRNMSNGWGPQSHIHVLLFVNDFEFREKALTEVPIQEAFEEYVNMLQKLKK